MTGNRVRGCLVAAAMLAEVSGLSIQAAQAQQITSQQFGFEIAPKPVTQAVNEIGRTAGLSVVFSENQSFTAVGRQVRGSMTAAQALTMLLTGTGLSFRFSNANTVQIFRPSAADDSSAAGADDATRLQAIVVLGDPATTEGTGSYRAEAVTIGKTERTFRQVPNTVSVTTRQQIDDQDLNSVQEVVAATNGATLIKADEVNERSELHFRGFAADSFMVDGSSVSGNSDVMTFDTAIYDRVEILKGPGGVSQGGREPAGAINLVRKKPTDERQIKADVEIGSWNRKRLDLDVSGPITDDGGVRGRIVGAFDTSDSFVDLVNSQRKVLYGAFDFDVTDQTILTLGGTWQEGEGRNSRGLPAYADGTLLDVPRSTFAGLDWANSETRSADVFAKLQHEFDGGATFNMSASYLNRNRDGKLAYANGAVNPLTGFTRLLPEHRIDREDNVNLDTSINIPFDVGGLEQSILLGADYYKADEELDMGRGSNIPFDIFNPDHGLPEPDFVFDRFDLVKNRQVGFYGQATIKPIEWGTIVLGGRTTWWDNHTGDRQTGIETSSASVDAKFTPAIAGIVDITDTTSVYASYASIFVPQDAVTASNEVIAPREGKQYEIGMKSQILDDMANVSLALFQIDDDNRAIGDIDNPGFSVASGKVRSRGIEAEISGEILPSWEIKAGYTYLTTKYLEDPDNNGAVFEPRAPRHSVRLWNKYTFDSGALENISIGGGVTAFSSYYRVEDGANFTQGGYAVVDLQLGYKFNEHLHASLTVTNLLDREYYQSVGGARRQNYFGDPRAITFKIGTTF
jgi:outer membrane receptor for ferric coprogen and ferric-rhodotorulic acid